MYTKNKQIETNMKGNIIIITSLMNFSGIIFLEIEEIKWGRVVK